MFGVRESVPYKLKNLWQNRRSSASDIVRELQTSIVFGNQGQNVSNTLTVHLARYNRLRHNYSVQVFHCSAVRKVPGAIVTGKRLKSEEFLKSLLNSLYIFSINDISSYLNIPCNMLCRTHKEVMHGINEQHSNWVKVWEI